MDNLAELPSFDNESDLIQNLYASLTDKNGFHTFLQLLGDSINASACVLTCLQRKPIAVRYVWHMGLPDGFVEHFNASGMLERDTVFNLAVKTSLRGFSTGSDALKELKQYGNAEYWEESYEMSMQMGFLQTMWMVIHAAEDNVIVLSLLRSADKEQYTDHELKKVSRLVPHIRQSFQLYEQVNKAMIKASSLDAVLDAVPKASIVLSDLSKVIHVNRSARELLAKNKIIRIEDDHVLFNNSTDQTDYSCNIVEVVRSSIGLTPFYSSTQYLKREGKPDLILCLTPIENIDQGRGGALITLYDPESRQLPDADRIAEYFSLTKAQATLCVDLISGLSIKDIAATKSKSEETIRSHMKHIFQKTDFNRQGQLVSGILSALME